MAVIDKYLNFLGEQGGSDLHLSARRRPMIRLDGTVVALKGDPLTPTATERIFEEIMPDQGRSEFGETGDTDFAYELEGVARFRVNVFRDRYGVGGALRLISNEVLSCDEIGLSEAVKDLCYLPKGMVLVTGPTGSGKSTTLASMIDLINTTRKCHIITIEDPIEYVHEDKSCRVNQREVHSHTKSFARALRAALRQDPDIVLVGEMRDLETTRMAIETAETGHLVFGTLHTTTAASTINRLIGQFPTNEQEQIRSMVAGNLQAVIAQMLLRKIPKGRVAAFEILIGTPALQVNIRERKVHQIPSLMQTGAKYGMVMLNDSLLKLVVQGTVEATEALANTVDREDLVRKLKVAGVEVEGSEATGLEV
ncbi:MAG: type IV pilus twitching motility protein PilT [Planctomycetota bacterium]